VASFGVDRKESLILKPDVPLLIGITAILVLATATVMVCVGYCLHKGWKIRQQMLAGYRKLNANMSIEHYNPVTYHDKSDFDKYKSAEQDEIDRDDDLDNINLDIHNDLLEAGQEYLKFYEERKGSRQAAT